MQGDTWGSPQEELESVALGKKEKEKVCCSAADIDLKLEAVSKQLNFLLSLQ